MWTNKRVVILGAARQGTALARYLVAQGARVTLSDMNAAADVGLLEEVRHLITFAFGGHPLSLLDDCDLLCLSGGVPIDLPIVLEARRRNIPLSNDAQIFFEVCPAPIIGITGSAGKTTTTTLIGEMLRTDRKVDSRQSSDRTSGQQPAASSQVWVGGNIGNPLISDVGQIRPDDAVVMELSSFQLELMTRSPHIACITNITPNHLDRHGTMDAYIAAKKHLIDFQTAQDWQVLCADDPVTRTLNTDARTAWFSLREEPQGDGAWMDEGGMLWLRVGGDGGRSGADAATVDGIPPVSRLSSPVSSIRICHRRELQLMGAHNVLNVLAASLVSTIAGASIEAVREVATTFRGVAHRLQLVSELNGARWYDDSIATAPERLVAALRCFDQRVILLCGGRDKHLPWAEAAQLMLERCKAILLFGEMGPMVAEELRKEKGKSQKAETKAAQDALPSAFLLFPSMSEAIDEAKRLAGPGDVVLLSPGGTSYDAFKDFAERGRAFRERVIYREVEDAATTLNQASPQTSPQSST